MSGGNQLSYVLIGACLATLLLAAPALAQQDVEEPSATVNEGQRITGEAPAPEEDSRENTEREETPPADPLPAPPPVDNETETEPACGPRCKAAQKRENADLVAQESMADSTQEIAGLTEWQLYAGGFGILLLGGTLLLTIRATNAAVDANRIARDTAQRQLRAYVLGKGFEQGLSIWDDKIRDYIVIVRWENVGHTPATDVQTVPIRLRQTPTTCSMSRRIIGRGTLHIVGVCVNRIGTVQTWIKFEKFPMNENREIIFTKTENVTYTVLGPHSSDKQSMITIPLQTVMEKWRGHTEILVWARVEYRDTFDPNVVRHHEQCSILEVIHDPSAIPPKGHPPYVIFQVYGPQNTTG